MKKKIKKKIKEKVKLLLFMLGMITFMAIVVAPSICALNRFSAETNYWIYFTSYTFLSVFFLLLCLMVVGGVIYENKKKFNVKFTIFGVVFVGIYLLVVINKTIPLDMDLYAVITKSYNEVEGTVVSDNIKSDKYELYTEVTVHDNKRNKDITITFKGQEIYSFIRGKDTSIEYLPHSYFGIAYKNT